MNADGLRKLANDLRNEAIKRAENKRTKCAQIVSAATGIDLLRRKLGGRDA